MALTLQLFIILQTLIQLIDGQCTWPSEFVSSTWTDNARGSLTFTQTTMSGWAFTKDSQVIDEWQCTNVDQFASDGYMVMRSVSSFIQFVTSHYYAYLCLKLTPITDTSYRYYIMEPQQPELEWDRYFVTVDESRSTVASVCFDAYGASGAEYKVMVKSGQENSAIIPCPWVVLGNFDYTYTSASGSTSCSAGSNTWSMCTDITKMSFDLSTCPVDVPYSGTGEVSCVDTVPVGSENFITVYNSGSFDGVNTYQFSCFAVNDDLSTASVAPGYCRHGQTSSDYPVDTSQNDLARSNIGGLVSITSVHETCLTCPLLDSPDGGSVDVETNGAVTTAYYVCDAGYALYGDAERICQQNNTWTGQSPSCKCEAPSDPDHGSVIVSADGSIATYTCDVGYVLAGNQYRGCQTNGNAWNGTDPVCETCSVLGDLVDGTVTLVQEGYTTAGIFTCNVGFSLSGAHNATCKTDSTWSDNMPTCFACQSLSNPSLGNITYTSDGLQTTAQFACFAGYKVLGAELLTCQADGTWNSNLPSCICEDPTAPDFGQVTVDGTGLSANYTCDVGYTMDGERTRECQMDGASWAGVIPSCVSCTSLPSPTGVNITFSSNGTQTSASYSCLPGYTITGEISSTCGSSGVWTQTATTCVSCETLSSPTSGNVTVTSNGTVSVAEYTCTSGYTLSGASARVCQQDGTWAGAAPECGCVELASIENGNLTITDQTAHFSCAVNYTLIGESTLVCLTDGAGWSSTSPSCVECQTLAELTGGNIAFTSPSGLKTVAEYTCEVGYTLVGTAALVCYTDGTWNGSAPYCQLCDPIQNPQNGTITLTSSGSQTTATFSCAVGFTVNDASFLTSECGQDGVWTSGNVECVACIELTDVSSGVVSIASNGTFTTATYECVFGYELVGVSTRTCLSTGAWTENEPQCKCESPGSIQDGSLSISSNGMLAYYTCDTGFSMNGAPNITCGDDGTGWDNSPPSCVRCEDLIDPANGVVTMATDGSTTRATYTCNIGYSFDGVGSTTSTCYSDGTWTDQISSCVLCDTLTSPDSGAMTLSFNDTSTQALFSCLTGYFLDGQGLLTCGQNGTWDYQTPSCVCEVPPAPSDGNVSVFDNGFNITYSCDLGYSLNGDGFRICQSNGQSWSGTAPSCVSCDTVPPLADGNIVFSSNGTVSEVAFSCNVGYTLYSITGETDIACGDDGTWNSVTISCVECGSLSSLSSGSISLSTDGFMTSAQFDCAAGYYMIGENTSVCDTSGTWTTSTPKCLCGLPSEPANGELTLANDNMTLTFTCDVGYILSGSSVRICNSDGTGWSGTQPTCDTCDPLSTLANGQFTLKTDGSITTAIFTCDSGSSLSGNPTITCSADGSWDLSPPDCVSCNSLVNPSSGAVVISTNGTLSNAVFSCSTDYHIVGSDVLFCQTDGSWSGTQPLCICDVPTAPSGGSTSLSGDNMTVYYSCDAGYTLSGQEMQLCATNGTGWSGSKPSCVSCPSVTAPTGGSVTVTTDGKTSTASFICDVEYTINGSSSITCTSSGTWDQVSASCVQCASLSSLDSGSVSLTTDGMQTVASYSCVTGYQINGDAPLTCQTNGQWSNTEPTCVCSPPLTPTNGVVDISDDGLTANFTCEAGYTLKGVATRNCQSSGAGWNEQQPTCETCGSLFNPNGGSVTLTTSGTVTIAKITCQSGYTINGGSILTCRSDGTWDISVPTCGVCYPLSSINSGSVELYSENSITKANFSCESGYSLSGTSLLTCRTDGSWDFNDPTCVKCEDLQGVSSGTVSIYSDGRYTYATASCVSGYYVNGDDLLTCNTDGSWDKALPSCVCNSLTEPWNGSVSMSSNGMIATFACDVGFTLDGNVNASCSSDGLGWENASPVCVSCPELTPVSGGLVEMTTDGSTTTWSLTCDVGTTITGTGTLYCGNDGTWSTTQPSCAACPTLISPTNGGVFLSTDGAETLAVFTCDIGYSINGEPIYTCLSDGSWDSVETTCAKCGSLSSVDSGDVTYSTDGAVTIATFSCVSGYFISGEVNISCLDDGSWNNSRSVCVCELPVVPTDGSLWISEDGMSLLYTCNAGFSLNGADNNSCGQDGSGWKYAHPKCVECQSIFEPANGGYTLSTDGSLTSAMFTCDAGYSLSSVYETLTCNDAGTWDQASLDCVLCETLTNPNNGFVNISISGSLSVAWFTCMTGYSLHGDAQRSCLTNGSWDLTQPRCVCNDPTAPGNGDVIISADSLTATYTCQKGYALSGVSQRYCGNDGTGWSDQKPTCVTCETLTSVTGGSLELWTDGISTFANYSCNLLFTINGQAVIQCRSDGTWNLNTPSCELCKGLSAVPGGTYAYSTDGETTAVTYECDVGYSMSGSQVSLCSSTGAWSASEPFCVLCTTLTTPDSGSVAFYTNGTVSRAMFTCTPGYHIVGDSASVCGEDGTWNSTAPVCVCDTPASISGGTVNISTNGEVATHVCGLGYTLNGNIHMYCASDGSGWNGTTPDCFICDSLASPSNGSLNIYTDGVSTYATVSCDVGFTSSGDVSLICQPDGTFNNVVPSCAECQTLTPPSDGNVTLSSNNTQTTATFTCDVGYTLSGESAIKCLSDGTWSSFSPICQICQQFQSIPSGSFSIWTDGSSTYGTVQCVTGYYLDGDAVVPCSEDGTWSHTPTCLCEDPAIPVNGGMTSTGTIATFTCEASYSLSGTSAAACGTNGEGWLTATPICVKCDTLSSLAEGEGHLATDGSQTYITYTCPVGYTLDGDVTSYCMSDGTWSTTVPSCASCGTLSDPDSGSIQFHSDNTTTSATYSCANGYQLIGNESRTCLNNGTWSNEEPICACLDPETPTNGNVSVTTDKTTAIYTCDVGYTINGESTRTCQTDGSGWSGTKPSCSLCGTITTPSGGTVSSSTDGAVTIATFTCSAGYTMDGGGTMACRDDGSWNTSQPTCVLCDSLSALQNGAFTTVTDGKSSTAIFTCNIGFTLQGTSDLTCAVSGKYSGSEPSCSQCDSLVTPDSGILTISTNGTVTTATYECETGYYPNGDLNLTCGTDGTWNGIEPECLCDPPPTISNGFYDISSDGSIVIYFCLEGYTMNGQGNLVCQSGGLGWNSSEPSCVGCNSLQTPENGSIEISTDGSVTSASVSCSVGTTLVGEPFVECSSSGTWTFSSLTCVICKELVSPANGNITLSTNDTVSTASFACSTGYALSGSDVVTCLSDGTWSDAVPTCVLCPVVAAIDNGDFTLISDGLSTTVLYTCHPDYGLSGSGSLTCRNDGSWNDSVPTCVCDPPLSLVDGNYSISNDGMTLTYSCDVSFTMVGNSVRSCAIDSSGWTGSPPTCTKCDELSSLADGEIFITTDGTTTTATFNCSLGFSLSGDYFAICDSTGQWNATAPSCVQCPTLNTITNGDVTALTDGVISTAVYVCLSGYHLVGDSQRDCLDGVWSGSSPSCLCSSSSFFANGDVVSNGSVISFTCNAGYSLSGASQRSCQDDGSGWSLTEPICEKCDSLSVPSGGNVTQSTDGSTTKAYFTCLTGYTMSGSSLLICGSDGTWDFQSPSCGVACSALSTPTAGHVTLQSDGLTTTALYECDANYALNGVSLLTCRTDGSWDFAEATCEICDVVASPTNGYVNVTTDGTTSVAHFTCHEGYYLDGDSMSTCSSDGTWSKSVPTCICNVPEQISDGTVSLSNGGFTATYTCSSGFTLYGSSIITCQDDYNGWTANDTKCVSCGIVPELQNGSVSIETDGITSRAELTCGTGYSIKGETTIQCDNDGLWTSVFPECVSCSTLQEIANGTTVTSTDGHTTSKTYQCFLGYSLNGHSEISCLEDGSWTASQPECVTCDEVSPPESGYQDDYTDGLVSYIVFYCVSGYHLVGNAIIQCRTDGSWNGSSPLCVCDVPSVPVNAALSFSSDDTILEYSCSAGSTLNGDLSRQCSNEGLGWLGSEPSCVKCSDLQSLVSGNETLTSNGSVSAVDFSCNVGFTLNGESQIACDENGVWSSNVPECVSCDNVHAPSSGSLAISTNGTVSTVYYSCDAGYVLIGDVTRSCSQDGKWTSQTPECVCDDPPTPVDGAVLADGYRATYKCDNGYTLYGEFIRVCINDSTGWNGTNPTCVACVSLNTPSGGSVSIATDGQTTSAVYSCETGYTISGTSTVTCGSDGTWDFTAATCVTCDTLSIPDNGKASLESIGSVTFAHFECNVGFTLEGFDQLTCRTTGSWDFTEPSCVRCDTLDNVSSGETSLNTDGTVTYVYYSCADGYHLTGVSNRTCGTDGHWTGTETLCNCDVPVMPENGTVLVSADGNTVSFSCNTAFTMVGSPTITCQEDGTGWNGTSPTCVQCDAFETPENGSVIYYSNNIVTSVNVICNVGASLQGPSEIACEADGTWAIQNNVACVSCLPLDDPSNGSTTMATNGTVTKALFSCNIGTSMSGLHEIECIDEGVWSGNVPVCEICPTMSAPSLSYEPLQYSSDGFVTTLTVACVDGYYTPGSASVNCTQGLWKGSLPECICDPLPVPSNGATSMSEDLMTTTFVCDNGYTMVGETTSFCQADGSGWDSSVPICVLCDILTEISSGSYVISSNGSVSIVTYTCDTGYTMSGTAERQCGITGGWTKVEPTCVSCPALSLPASGSVTVTTNGQVSEAVYSCVNGYLLSDDSMRQCLVNATWSSEQPTCYCALPTAPLNGDVVYGNYLSVARFTCDSGFTLHGFSEGYCQDDGSGWNTTTPECVACSTLSSSPGANLNISTDGVTSTAVYECGVGYTMQGDTNLVCRSDGTWNVQPPSCVSCETLDLSDGGGIDFTTDGLVTQATILCQAGYTISGAQTLTCKTDGTWDFTAGSCVECPTLEGTDSGQINITTDGSVTTAVFLCEQGYYLDGSVILTCATDGTWSDQTPTCKCNQPESVENGNYVISNNGFSVDYTCIVGYSMNGSNTRSCDDNGNGWSGNSPQCYKCDDLSDHVNGTVTMSTDGDTTTATFACDVGYSVSGNPVVQCTQDGTWDLQQPTCTKCETITTPANGTVQWVTNNTVSEAMFACDVGYTLVGSLSLTCTSDGVFEGTSPTCVVCPELDVPNNGAVTIYTNGSITKAAYECEPNYSQIGSEELLCLDGSWNDSPSYCECSAFSKPADGGIIVSDDGKTASYSCDPGFTLNGETEQDCGSQSSVSWSQTAPSCTACDTLAVSGVSYTFSSDGATTTVTFECDIGYTMVGESTSSCRSDGSWTTTVPSCETCETLSQQTGGVISFSSDGSTTKATVTCDPGYSLNGVVNMTCRADGSWDYSTAACVKCPDLEKPPSGNVNVTTDGTVTKGMFECVDGYFVNGPSSITCDVDGTWSAEAPSCLCDPPDSLLNGAYIVSDDGLELMYGCDLGYSMNGSSTRTCGSDGSGWSLQAPTCFECDNLLQQTNGSVSLTSDGVTTVATFSCDIGYALSGNPVVQCQPDGSWPFVQASCEKCTERSQPENGTLSFTTNGTVTSTQYTCNVGFTLSGSSEIMCASDGTWTDQSPFCVSCSLPDSLENGEVSVSTNGSLTVALFTCDNDYSLNGNEIIACTTSGLWNGTSPECVCSTFTKPDDGTIVISDKGTKATYSCAAGFTLTGDSSQICGQNILGEALEAPTCTLCESLSTSSGASFDLYTNGSQTVAIFQCAAGYTMLGTSNLTCRTDGTWDVTPPQCKTCETLPTFSGNVSFSTDGEQTVASFTCDLGSSLSGQATLLCRTDGTWDFAKPECISCSDLSNPTNGQVNRTTDGQVSVATFSCTYGYYLTGTETLTCLEDGAWDNNTPACLCDPPEDILNGAYSISNDGMSVTYTCNVNYTLDGTTTRVCSSDGNGWTGVAPYCYMCDDLSDHSSGTIAIYTDGISTSAIFTCGQGYTMSGPSVIQCLSTGTWDLLQPSCEKCEDVSAPNDGTLLLNSNGTTTHAEYSCHLGFTLSGSLDIFCSDDGTWTGDTPYCVSCQSVTNTDNGEVTLSTNGSVTTATYTCFQDYALQGEAVLVCSTSGTWEGSAPHCVCSTFTAPTGGSIEISDDGTEAIYSCGAGSTLSGDIAQVCGDVSVGGTALTQPTCILCETMSASSGATFELSTDGSQTVAIFQCPTGYTMVGSSNLTCRTDGSWDNSPPSCETCVTLQTLSDGIISFITDGEQTQALFTCNVGATLSGQSPMTCRKDGTWDFAEPECVNCPLLVDPVNGQVNVSTDGQTSVALFTCTNSYYIFGTETLTCSDSGAWDHESPSCRCIPPSSILNGTVLISDDGGSVSYVCAVGFSLNGDSLRTCGSDGTEWSGSQPVCELCHSISTTLNLDFNLKTDGTRTSAQFTCNTGSTINGESTLLCLSDGKWNNAFPTCVTCPTLTADSSGVLSSSSNGTVTIAVFECAEGFALVGDVESECMADGSWSNTEPTCVQCLAVASPSNGEVSMSVIGSTTWATFTCNDGYSMTGASQIYCTSTGVWDSNIPTCDCNSFSEPLDGNIHIADNGTLAIYSCDVGYSLSGEPAQHCSDPSDSAYSTEPSCVPCESLSPSARSSVTQSTEGLNTIASYRCDEGYVLSGERVLTCGSDGTWNYQPPTCSVCNPLDQPEGGSVVLNSDGENTTALHTCVTGFSLVGKSDLTCKSEGSWDFIQPSCVCNQPVSLEHGDFILSSDKLMASYSCDVGYTLSGPDKRQCRTNGSWWDGNDPVCSKCAALTAGTGMNITLTSDGKTTAAIFRCEIGYSLSHKNNVTCFDDGSWNIDSPTCVQCGSLNTTLALSFTLESDGFTTKATFTCANGYGMSGPQTTTCIGNGSWVIGQPTCFTASEQSEQGCSASGSSGAAIAFGILFGLATIAAIVLAVVAWRYWRKYESLGGHKAEPYVKGEVKQNPLFFEVSPSRAPVSHERHVTDMGRAGTSLAPRGHQKHIINTENISPVHTPAPMTTRDIEIQKPPLITGRLSSTRSPAISSTHSSLGETSLDIYLPQHIFMTSPVSNVDVPHIHVEETKSKRTDKGQKNKRKNNSGQKSSKLSPFLPIKEMKGQNIYREGSPLPQQILTPRNADDVVQDQEKKHKTQGTEEKPKHRRMKKPKGDLIDKDRNLLKIYNKKGTDSPTQGISSPQYQQISGTEQEHEISDIEV